MCCLAHGGGFLGFSVIPTQQPASISPKIINCFHQILSDLILIKMCLVFSSHTLCKYKNNTKNCFIIANTMLTLELLYVYVCVQSAHVCAPVDAIF